MGVAQTPLQPDDPDRWNNSWCIEAGTGDLYHNGQPTGNSLFTLSQGDTLTLEYIVSSSELKLGKNGDEMKKAFDQVFVASKTLSPFVLFVNADGPRKVCAPILILRIFM